MTDETTQTSIFDSTPDTQMYEYKITLEKIQGELSQYGLTSNQSKVFIYLGKYGAKTAPEVCKALKLPRTETYNVLNDLLNLGIISSEFHHPTNKRPFCPYMADAPPYARLLNIIALTVRIKNTLQ